MLKIQQELHYPNVTRNDDRSRSIKYSDQKRFNQLEMGLAILKDGFFQTIEKFSSSYLLIRLRLFLAQLLSPKSSVWIGMILLSMSSMGLMAQELRGVWQLAHVDEIDRIRASADYQSAPELGRENIEYQIKTRLESTVYRFYSEDSMSYTDRDNGRLILKKARYEVKGDTLIIRQIVSDRLATILHLTDDKLVIQSLPSGEETRFQTLYFRRKEEVKE